MSVNELKGKVVLIAGGAKNLGGLLSRNFAEKGAKVAIHYNSDSTKDAAEETLADIQAKGGEAFYLKRISKRLRISVNFLLKLRRSMAVLISPSIPSVRY